MICARCHRFLFRTPIDVAGMPMGPKCAAAVRGGSAPRRPRITSVHSLARDPRQTDLFQEARP